MILSRTRLMMAATVVLALSACTERTPLYTPKQLRAVSAETRELMQAIDADKYSPILMRVFKAEGKLEVWKRTRNNEKFALLRTYDICRWSGDLGPKRKEGDRQAPEGFYPIAPGQLNPRSSYFLAFDTGYPNAFDRAHERTGSNLMVHGDCSSRGCFAMTDTQMQEIFALARDAFDGGQRAFQMQIMPFRMTEANLHRFRHNENITFWRMLKEGSDHFEATLREPDVQVCGKRYIFNQRPLDPAAKFSPAEACPAAETPTDITQAVAAKRKSDAIKLAEYLESEHGKANASRAAHTPVPVHAIYKTRQVIRASLPSAGPEALTLLPGAEAGPTQELRQIARGEVQPPPVEGEASAENSGQDSKSPAPVIAAAQPPAAAPAIPAQKQAEPPAPATTAAAPAAAQAAPQPAISGLFSNVVAAFAPADQRSNTTAITGTAAPNAPRPVPSPLRKQLADAPALAPATGGDVAKPKSDANFLEKTFGAISLPGFGGGSSPQQ